MTDKTMRGKVLEALDDKKCWTCKHVDDTVYSCYECDVDAILAISEIKEGQKLREKAKSGKLVELDENQSWPSDPFYPIEKFRIRNYNQLCENSGFRRVKA